VAKEKKVLDIGSLAEKIRKTYKDQKKATIISTGAEMTTPTEPEDFVVMPEWWQKMSGCLGLPFGYVVMIAGNTDSGKTSATIEAIKSAQEQDISVILADTEKKTTAKRLLNWGVNPEQVARVQPEYLEEMYDGIEHWWNAIKDANPDQKILIVIDSLGNTPAKKEAESDVEDTLQLGVAAKTNKRAFRRMVSRLKSENVVILVINQTYNNLGSPGKSNAGGKAVDFFSCLTYQTARKKWLEKGKDEKAERIGARVTWTLYKNHLIDVDQKMMKSAQIDITKDGMHLVDLAKEKKEKKK